MLEVAVIVAAVPALAIATPPAVLINDVGSFDDAGGFIPDCVELNVGGGVSHILLLFAAVPFDKDKLP